MNDDDQDEDRPTADVEDAQVEPEDEQSESDEEGAEPEDEQSESDEEGAEPEDDQAGPEDEPGVSDQEQDLDEDPEPLDAEDEPADEDARSDGSSARPMSAVEAVRSAKEQFEILTGRTPESVIGAVWDEDRWTIRLEVVETRRVPETSDLLAEYEVELDERGDVRSYSRGDRYVRGRPTE